MRIQSPAEDANVARTRVNFGELNIAYSRRPPRNVKPWELCVEISARVKEPSAKGGSCKGGGAGRMLCTRCFSCSVQCSQDCRGSPRTGSPITLDNFIRPRSPVVKTSCYAETIKLPFKFFFLSLLHHSMEISALNSIGFRYVKVSFT